MILQDGKATIQIQICSDGNAILHQWLEDILSEISFPCKSGYAVLICADEIYANISAYAYPSGKGDFSVSAVFDPAGKELELIFSDHGIPFDPLHHEAADISVPIEQRKPGGLGILVIRRMMDHVEYRREGDFNILTLKKNAGDSK